ncbi:MAG: restriction endonuclease [Candidatus Pacebacteria bacterium]|nr:restriction endonuclease [Candidatus Paceibacterota bacterium]
MTNKKTTQAIIFFSCIFWGLTFLYLVFLWITENQYFWYALIYGVVFSVVIALILIAFKIKEKKDENIKDVKVIKKDLKFSSLNYNKFENLMIRLFGTMGYIVEDIGEEGNNGLILYKNKKKIFVDFDKEESIEKKEIIENITKGSKKNNCKKGILIFISDISNVSKKQAKESDIELVDKKYLQELLLSYLAEDWQ